MMECIVVWEYNIRTLRGHIGAKATVWTNTLSGINKIHVDCKNVIL
jgi:hypothetical protein